MFRHDDVLTVNKTTVSLDIIIEAARKNVKQHHSKHMIHDVAERYSSPASGSVVVVKD